MQATKAFFFGGDTSKAARVGTAVGRGLRLAAIAATGIGAAYWLL